MKVVLVANFQIEYTIQLANALSERVEVSLAIWDRLVPEQLALLNPHIQVIGIGSPGKSPSSRLWNQLSMTIDLCAIEPDIVHFQNAYLWEVPWLPLLPHSRRIITIHDPFPHEGLPDPMSFPAIAMNLRAANGLILMGQSQRDMFLSRFRIEPERVAVIPHGEFSYFSHFATIPEDDGQTVLFIGRIAEYKGLETFLKAAVKLGRVGRDIRFRVVGYGDVRPYLGLIRAVPRLDLVNRFVSPRELGMEIGRSSVVVCPYSQASQSGIAIAAQSLGRPVIATRVGGLADDVLDQRTGILVPPGDWSGVADAVLDLVDNKDKRRAMGHAAREWMTRERAWSHIADMTLKFYEVSR